MPATPSTCTPVPAKLKLLPVKFALAAKVILLVKVCAPIVLTEPVKIVEAAVDVTDKLLRALT